MRTTPWPKDYAFGLVLLGVVVFLWTTSNFVTQALLLHGFKKPFLVTYLNTSSFALYLLPFFWRRWQRNSQNGGEPRGHVTDYQPLTTGPGSEDEVPSSVENILRPLTIRETSDLALIFCFLWFIANWSVNASLYYTSVASATILSSMSGVFTLAIGRMFVVETLTPMKVYGVIMSLLGVVLVSLSDSSTTEEPAPGPFVDWIDNRPTRPVLGDSLALISALFYALYVVLLKVRIRSESRIDMQLFFGFVGLFNILTCWIIGAFLHLSGIEPFELPNTGSAIGAILFNMLITLISDYLYLLSMLKTTPLVVTVGLSLTIPLAVIGDLLFGKPTGTLVLVGAMLVLVSFIMVGLDDSKIHLKQEEESIR